MRLTTAIEIARNSSRRGDLGRAARALAGHIERDGAGLTRLLARLDRLEFDDPDGNPMLSVSEIRQLLDAPHGVNP